MRPGEDARIALTLPSPRGRGKKESASVWRHLKAPAGVAAPQSRNLVGGEDCLSEASSAALTFGTEAKAPKGPRLGAHGFGSFCRNKRTSACGAETPRAFLPLGVRGRNPASTSPFLSSSTLVIEDPGSLYFAFLPAPSHGATSRRLRARLRPSPELYLGARTV